MCCYLGVYVLLYSLLCFLVLIGFSYLHLYSFKYNVTSTTPVRSCPHELDAVISTTILEVKMVRSGLSYPVLIEKVLHYGTNKTARSNKHNVETSPIKKIL